MTSRAESDELHLEWRETMRARRYRSEALTIGLVLCGGLWAADQRPATSPKMPCQEMEAFLRTAKIGPQRNIPKGVTQPKQATLDNGNLRHKSGIQVIHETKIS